MTQDWIVLDFRRWVGEAQGLDWWWPSGSRDVHRPRREDPRGLCCGLQRPEVQGKREGHQRKEMGSPSWPSTGLSKSLA